MSAVLDNRAELANALAGVEGITVYDHLPGAAVAPSAIILRGSPWIEDGEQFGTRLVRWTVYVSAPGTANAVADEINFGLTVDVLDALVSDGWSIETVSDPFQLDLGNSQLLTSEITLTSTIRWTN